MSTTVQQVKNDALRRGLVTLLSTLTAAGGAVKLFTPAVVDRNGTTMARAVGRAVKDPGPVLVAEHPCGRDRFNFNSTISRFRLESLRFRVRAVHVRYLPLTTQQ